MLCQGEVKAYAHSDMKFPLASEDILLHVHIVTILLSTLYK